MALRLMSTPTVTNQNRFSCKLSHRLLVGQQFNLGKNAAVGCISSTARNVVPATVPKPNYWDYDHMMSLTSDYTGDGHKVQLEELKTSVRKYFANAVGLIPKLELIDLVQRLGVGYHFENEIKCILELAFTKDVDSYLNGDLRATSLRFRLLRQHGYLVPQEIFESFKDDMGNFRSTTVSEDAVEGMLSLYEASYLSFEGESIMDEAKDFTTKYLKDANNRHIISPSLAKKVSRSLKVPLHWRAPRIEARWYIDLYEAEENMKPALVEFAKLDYNMVQAVHQIELGNLARWWMELGLQKHLSFVRDKLMVYFIWFASITPEPKFGNCRQVLTKFIILSTVLDDMYDSYASLEELQLFTDAIERWDMRAMEGLPTYMKIIYMALLNTSYETSFKILKEHGYDVSSIQKKAWVEHLKAFMVEAKWEKHGIRPTTKEFLDVGVQSIGVLLSHMHCYFLTTQEITEEAIKCIEAEHNLIYCPAMILRLSDDLSSPQLEVKSNAIECYMRELSVSEEVAREHIKKLISEIWKKMNRANVDSHPFSEPFTSSTFNMCRLAGSFMVSGDAHDAMSTIVEPVPFRI